MLHFSLRLRELSFAFASAFALAALPPPGLFDAIKLLRVERLDVVASVPVLTKKTNLLIKIYHGSEDLWGFSFFARRRGVKKSLSKIFFFIEWELLAEKIYNSSTVVLYQLLPGSAV